MIDFVEYVVSELKSKRLSKTDALALLKQFSVHASTDVQTFNIHPLLHINTSNLSQQSYSTVFTGDEFFLNDHQVHDQKILPAVVYLEMARAAVEAAIPVISGSGIIELHNVVWVQPIVVEDPKEITVALFSDSAIIDSVGKINFEIYSIDSENETIHCQGQAIIVQNPTLPAIDLIQLKAQMTIGKLEASAIYPVFKKMGASFGPAHQGIKILFQGGKQLVAALCLPSVVEPGYEAYLLHPALMDGALQASIGLWGDINKLDPHPSLPFALDTLSILSPCKKEMFAWVRFSQGSQPGDRLEKLDIDMFDNEGKICVQMKGYSSRILVNNINIEKAQDIQFGTIMATPVWRPTGIVVLNEKPHIFAQQHIILFELPKVDSLQLESLLLHSKSHHLQLPKQENVSERFDNHALVCFETLQSILKSKPQGKVLVQIVIPDNQEETLLAGLSGLLQTVNLENPDFLGQILFTESQTTTDQLAQQLRYDQCKPSDTIIQYKSGIRNVLRWELIPVNQNEPAIAFKEGGIYVITGGLGGLGVLFAKEILQRTAKSRIILTGRSGPEQLKEKQSVLAALRAIRDDIEYRQLDLENTAQVEVFIAAIMQEYHQINGIIHSAGMISDSFILKKTNDEFHQVLMPKVRGTFNLDKASERIELDFFVLFSSVASPFGNIGQADYATANGFMDQFASYRNKLMDGKQRYGRTLSINWPLWQEGGMNPDTATQELLKQTTGMYPMTTATGMQSFYKGLELAYSQILVMEGELQQMQALLEESKIKAELPLLIQEHQTVVTKKIKTPLNADHLVKETQDYLRKQFSAILRLPAHKIDIQEPLEKYGIDSILAMSLTNQLEKTFGSLPKTLFFEYQTLHELSEYFIKSFNETLNALFTKTDENQQRPVKAVVVKTKSTIRNQTISLNVRQVHRHRQTKTSASNALVDSDPIAIIGLSGRYPESVDIEAYWENLRDGKDCIREIPESRWNWREYYSEDRSDNGHHFSKWGGFISGVDEFDPRFFNISPREAIFLDPQERLFLQHTWMAIEDAGYTRTSLQIPHEQDLAGQVGVYVGVMYSEYQLFGVEAGLRGKPLSIPGSYASIANRVSYVLNLHGPSMTLDTMCSSSLAAIHLACQDLKLGRTQLAIAGGVNVTIHPNKYLFLSDNQFISTDGHCQSFGEGGDGYIPGEGVGAVILKKLSDAIKDGNHIYGIIKGSALNHGGKTNGYSVPNPQAQTAVISRALAESKTNPRHISYIEAHGTGTKLGDPIEIAAISKAFQQHTQENGFCFIGSNKSNIGHCESAAGVSALTKVLLQMKYHKIAPSLHSSTLNPFIDFQKTPFVVNQTLREWEQPVIDGQTWPRIAGISAFGAGGSNAHLIVQEYAPKPNPTVLADQFTEVIIPLSARTQEQLKQKAKDLLKFITSAELNNNNKSKEHERELNKKSYLVSIAYTLQVGREAMDERLCFIVNSVDLLAGKLQAYINGETDIENTSLGEIKSNKGLMSSIGSDGDFDDTINKWIAGKKLLKLTELWVNGLHLDWNNLYGDAKPPLISLPTYPFAREKYWIDATYHGHVAGSVKSSPVLHPLLHTNTSTLGQQRYSSMFSGQEFFLKDYQIHTMNNSGQKMFPEMAFLEMAVAAIKHSSTNPEESKIVELHNVAWGQPALFNTHKQIMIALYADDIDDQQIEFEIYSQENGLETVHCLGQAVFINQQPVARLDIGHLIRQTGQKRSDTNDLYKLLNRMGFNYGPTFQCLQAVYKGNGVLLAELSLPSALDNVQNEFVLHPVIINSAVHASVGLIIRDNIPTHPLFPIALESLKVYAACSEKMFAYIHYSAQVQLPEDKHRKLDIDLCDQDGNICVQMKGLSLQELLFNFDNQTNAEMMPVEQDFIASPAIWMKPQLIQLTGLNDLNSVTGVIKESNKPQTIQLVNS